MPNGQEIADPLSLNLYTYCHNSPVRYADPSGNSILAIALIMLAGAVIGGISNAGINLVSQMIGNGGSWENVDWDSVAISFVTGAIGGAVGASPVGSLGQILVAMALGGGEYTAQTLHNGNDINVGELITTTLVSGVFGYIGGPGATNTNVTGYKLVGGANGFTILEITHTHPLDAAAALKNLLAGMFIETTVQVVVVDNVIQVIFPDGSDSKNSSSGGGGAVWEIMCS